MRTKRTQTILLILFLGLLLAGCGSAPNLFLGQWREGSGSLVEFKEDGKGTWGGTPFTYELIGNGKQIKATNALFAKTFDVVRPSETEATLTDQYGGVYHLTRESASTSTVESVKTAAPQAVPAQTEAPKAVEIPAVTDLQAGEIARMGSDVITLLGWHWMDDNCQVLAAPTDRTDLVAEVFVRHLEKKRIVGLNNATYRDDTGQSYTAVKEKGIVKNILAGTYCTPVGGTLSPDLTTTPIEQFPDGYPITEHYYLVSRSDNSRFDWASMKNIRLVLEANYYKGSDWTTALINYRLGDKPADFPIPAELDPLAVITKTPDGVGPYATIQLDPASLVRKTSVDYQRDSYTFNLTLTNTSQEVVQVDPVFWAMDRFGSFHQGELDKDEKLAPGDSLKVKGQIDLSLYPNRSRVFLIFNRGPLQQAMLLELPEKKDQAAQVTPTAQPTHAPAGQVASAGSSLPKVDSKGYVAPYEACPAAKPSRIISGIHVQVILGGLPNRVRTEAGTNNAMIGQLAPGTESIVLEGPLCANGLVWWKVDPVKKETAPGWTAEGDSSAYWLAPCPLKGDCPKQ